MRTFRRSRAIPREAWDECPRVLSAIGALPLLISALGCSLPPPPAEQAEAAVFNEPGLVRLDEEGPRLAQIQLGAADVREVREDLRVPGHIAVDETLTARVGSFAGGIAVECCKPVGTRVKAGDVLARLHSHEIHDGESVFWEARGHLEQRRSDLLLAEESHQRASRLYELKAGSLRHAREAEARLRSARASVAIAEAKLEQAERHLRYLGLDPEGLARSGHTGETEALHLVAVRSPIAGTVIERTVSPGSTPSAICERCG